MPNSEQQIDGARERRREIAIGCAIIWGINLAHAVTGYATISLGIGIVLLAFYVPIQAAYGAILIILARKNELYDRSKGMLIAGAVTTLLSSTCTYAVFHNGWGIG